MWVVREAGGKRDGVADWRDKEESGDDDGRWPCCHPTVCSNDNSLANVLEFNQGGVDAQGTSKRADCRSLEVTSRQTDRWGQRMRGGRGGKVSKQAKRRRSAGHGGVGQEVSQRPRPT